MNAIILAGALNNGALSKVCDVKYEAEIDIAGKPMVEYVIDALSEVAAIENVVLVTFASEKLSRLKDKVYYLVEPGKTLIDSLSNALTALHSNQPVLVVSADVPMLTREAVEDFLARCQTDKGDVYYPFVSKEENERKYPGVRRTYVKLQEGEFTGGNLVLLSPQAIQDNLNLLRQAVSLRKKPFKLCKMLGFRYLMKMVGGKLSIDEIEKKVQTMLGFKAIGVCSPYPEVGVDVDKPSDWELANQKLADY